MEELNFNDYSEFVDNILSSNSNFVVVSKKNDTIWILQYLVLYGKILNSIEFNTIKDIEENYQGEYIISLCGEDIFCYKLNYNSDKYNGVSYVLDTCNSKCLKLFNSPTIISIC